MNTTNKPIYFIVSAKSIAKIFRNGFLLWVAFNLVTGFITGDKSFDDNYFVLILTIIYAVFIGLKRIKVDRGHITIYQATMV